MFGLGTWELVIIVGVALLILGPALLPRLGGVLGRAIVDLKDSAEAFNDNLRAGMDREGTPRALADGAEVAAAEDELRA